MPSLSRLLKPTVAQVEPRRDRRRHLLLLSPLPATSPGPRRVGPPSPGDGARHLARRDGQPVPHLGRGALPGQAGSDGGGDGRIPGLHQRGAGDRAVPARDRQHGRVRAARAAGDPGSRAGGGRGGRRRRQRRLHRPAGCGAGGSARVGGGSRARPREPPTAVRRHGGERGPQRARAAVRGVRSSRGGLDHRRLQRAPGRRAAPWVPPRSTRRRSGSTRRCRGCRASIW